MVNKILTNGTFRTLREIIYVISAVVIMTLAWGKLTSAVEQNSKEIIRNSARIEELETLVSENTAQHQRIIANQEWVMERLRNLK
ncbi:MAG: hypothetical protein ABIH39_02890 [Candidatus Margulisiibacteriota bacterium]